MLEKILPMLVGDELIYKLSVLPKYDSEICKAPVAERLMALSDLYSLYIPTDMSVEVYCKLYIALIHSLKQKNTLTAKRQIYENYKATKLQVYSGLMGGLDAFVITGNSGVGKSSAISRAISAIVDDDVIEINLPSYQKIIPFLVVQTPFDCSLKSLLLEILRNVDELLGTRYYYNSLRVHATTDVLIGTVSTVCLNHIGVLICDEIQNVVNSKNGKSLVGSITQLINNAGISIVFVGTPSVVPFLEADYMLARRMMNLQYSPLEYDQRFYDICYIVWNYQFVQNRSEFSQEIVAWLYNHSNGNISVVISLLHDAQEIAILRTLESLSIETLTLAYQQRLNLLHGFISPQKRTYNRCHKDDFCSCEKTDLNLEDEHLILQLTARAKALNVNVVDILREYITIEEVTI